MGVIAAIDSEPVVAEPGAATSCTVRVRNTGTVVDQVILDVLGDARSWSTVEPATLNLMPGTDAVSQLVFRPPRSAEVPAGMVPFAIRAMSREDPDGSAIDESSVEVRPFSEVSAELVPATRRGRRKARYRLVVENQGNRPVQAAVSVADPDLLLHFRVKPQTLLARPDTATFVGLQAMPKRRFLRGPDRTLPFQVLVQAEDCPPVTTNGAMIQQQTLPRWLLPAAAIVAAAAAAIVALWFAVLKPEVHTAATQAVAAAAQRLNSSAAKASQAAAQADQAAQRANSAAGGSAAGTTGTAGKKDAGAPSPAAGSPAAAGGAVTPVSSLLQSAAPPSATFSTVPFALSPGQTLDVTDIVLQNPLGDTGLLQIRSGAKVLFEFGLANFRSIDYHFVQPLIFSQSAPLILAVQCQNTSGKACTAGLSFSGTLHK